MVELSSDVASGSGLTASTIISAQAPDVLFAQKMEEERRELMTDVNYIFVGGHMSIRDMNETDSSEL